MANPGRNFLSGTWSAMPSPFPTAGVNPFPEDIESSDITNIQMLIDQYFENAYPDFEPQIVTRIDRGETKEYYLPALKVLKLSEGKLFSPNREVEWKNMECRAECQVDALYQRIAYAESYAPKPPHLAPDENCNCGIYGSVNLDEIIEYRLLEHHQPSTYRPQYYATWDMNGHPSYPSPMPIRNVLCVIEPFPDAKVIICRKGWKASHAFISEFVGETISVEQTSQLLSIAWCRNIDIRRIYENR